MVVETEGAEAEQPSEIELKKANAENEGVCAKTNRNLPIFWCATCCTKLTSPTQAITHLNGKSHKSKVTQESRKRALSGHEEDCGTENEGNGPTTKKTKAEPIEVEHCKDCDILLNSAVMADQHYKGKKHASTVAKKEKAKNMPPDTIPVPEEIAKSHFCQCCQVPLNSDEQAQQHVNGQRHKVKAGIIVKKPPPPPPSSKTIYPPQDSGKAANGSRGHGNRGRGSRGRGSRGGNFLHGGAGRGWVKGGIDFVSGNEHYSTSSGYVNTSAGDKGRGRGWSYSRGSSNAYRGQTGGSRGRGYHSSTTGGAVKATETGYSGYQGSGSNCGWGYPNHNGHTSSNTTTQSSQGKVNQPNATGSGTSEYKYSSYNFNTTPKAESSGSYQSYNYNAGAQNSYQTTAKTDEKPANTSNSNQHSNDGYSTAGYYEQNQYSQGANISPPPPPPTPSQYAYYSSDYNKDAGYYSYGYSEQKPPAVQAADATYDSYYG